ncbi:hypothetical protein TSMEX_008418 [Taenia solium]|eukprot:TsM_000449300 transcript=TsM_000449300 gene=TsM_000449300
MQIIPIFTLPSEEIHQTLEHPPPPNTAQPISGLFRGICSANLPLP